MPQQMGVADFTMVMNDVYRRPLIRGYMWSENPTYNILNSRSIRFTGRSGKGVRASYDLAKPTSTFWDFMDRPPKVQMKRALLTKETRWVNLVGRVGVSRTELREETGLTPDTLIDTSTVTGQEGGTSPGDRLIDLLKLRISGLRNSMIEQVACSGWGVPLPDGLPEEMEYDRLPETYHQFFDPEQPFSNLEPDGLGEWRPNHMWANGDSPGNGLTPSQKKLVNVPRVFSAASVPFNKAFFAKMMSTMSIAGSWWGVMHPVQFAELSIEFDNKYLPPRLMGGKLEWNVDAIEYNKCLLFADWRMPMDEVYLFYNRGPLSARSGDMMPGLEFCYWAPRGTSDLEFDASARPAPIAANPDVKAIGWDTSVPLYDSKWWADNYNTIGCLVGELHLTYSMVGWQRQYCIRIKDIPIPSNNLAA